MPAISVICPTFNSARFVTRTLEKRNLKLVSGKFGQALLNDNDFSPADFEKMYMSTRDLDVLLEVLCFHRFKYDQLRIGGRQPYFWGTGRLTTDGITRRTCGISAMVNLSPLAVSFLLGANRRAR